MTCSNNVIIFLAKIAKIREIPENLIPTKINPTKTEVFKFLIFFLSHSYILKFFLTKSLFFHRGQKGIAGQGSDKPFSENTAVDWVPDPNEPTYCLCNQVTR